MNWSTCCELLLNGDYDNGWPDHNDIVNISAEKGVFEPSNYGKPVWDGSCEPITLLVNAEFGDGDTIHFFRFIKLAQQKVKKVILRCNADFKNLFSKIEIVGKDQSLPEFDKVIHMMALPKVLGIKKAQLSGESYLIPNNLLAPPVFTQCVSKMKFFKAGVCWAGNPFNRRDHHRSFDVSLLKSLGPDDFPYFSLNNLFEPPSNFFDTRTVMHDWNETAHLIDAMNLVITVDTAVAHLAGALGRPVWLLVSPDAQEWRWGTEGEATIWYNSMTVFRKKTSWEDLLQEVSARFTELVSSWSEAQPNGALGGAAEQDLIVSV